MNATNMLLTKEFWNEHKSGQWLLQWFPSGVSLLVLMKLFVCIGRVEILFAWARYDIWLHSQMNKTVQTHMNRSKLANIIYHIHCYLAFRWICVAVVVVIIIIIAIAIAVGKEHNKVISVIDLDSIAYE